jgi:hypothetical protein
VSRAKAKDEKAVDMKGSGSTTWTKHAMKKQPKRRSGRRLAGVAAAAGLALAAAAPGMASASVTIGSAPAGDGRYYSTTYTLSQVERRESGAYWAPAMNQYAQTVVAPAGTTRLSDFRVMLTASGAQQVQLVLSRGTDCHATMPMNCSRIWRRDVTLTQSSYDYFDPYEKVPLAKFPVDVAVTPGRQYFFAIKSLVPRANVYLYRCTVECFDGGTGWSGQSGFLWNRASDLMFRATFATAT